MPSDGFLVVPNALDRDTVDRLLHEADTLADPFLRKPVIADKPEYNHLDLRRGLLKQKALYALVSHSATVSLIVQLLGANIHLHSTTVIYKRPENPDAPTFRRGWHRDIRMARDLGHERLPLAGIKVCYCLTDFQQPNSGMTLMARGTHLRTEPLRIPKGAVDPVDAEVCDLKLKAGDALLFEHRVFHTAAPNRSDQTSKVVIYGYSYRWMRPGGLSRSAGRTATLASGSHYAPTSRWLSRRRYAAVGARALGQKTRPASQVSLMDHRSVNTHVIARRPTTK